MEIIINIGGKDIPFKSTGKTLLVYKLQTGRDPVYDFLNIISTFSQKGSTVYLDEAFREIGLEPLYYMAWAFAKTADPNIPPPMEWLDSFETFPIFEIFSELLPLLTKSFAQDIEVKKKEN